MVPDTFAHFPSFPGKHLVQVLPPPGSVGLRCSGARESVYQDQVQGVRVEEARSGNGDYKALQSCWFKIYRASLGESETGPKHRGQHSGQGETQKEAYLTSKGTQRFALGSCKRNRSRHSPPDIFKVLNRGGVRCLPLLTGSRVT